MVVGQLTHFEGFWRKDIIKMSFRELLYMIMIFLPQYHYSNLLLPKLSALICISEYVRSVCILSYLHTSLLNEISFDVPSWVFWYWKQKSKLYLLRLFNNKYKYPKQNFEYPLLMSSWIWTNTLKNSHRLRMKQSNTHLDRTLRNSKFGFKSLITWATY